jgi:nucleotide-binding universal stress UspA family protein
VKQRILIALDDSENAMRAVDYTAAHLSPQSEVTLFHVLPDTAVLCDMTSPELTPVFTAEQQSFCILEAQKRNLVEQAAERARQTLMAAGFSEGDIQIKIETKKRGIARDIAEEAEQGYDLVVIGRRGISGFRDYFLGSVSQKVLHLAKNVSLLFVD